MDSEQMVSQSAGKKSIGLLPRVLDDFLEEACSNHFLKNEELTRRGADKGVPKVVQSGQRQGALEQHRAPWWFGCFGRWLGVSGTVVPCATGKAAALPSLRCIFRGTLVRFASGQQP